MPLPAEIEVGEYPQPLAFDLLAAIVLREVHANQVHVGRETGQADVLPVDHAERLGLGHGQGLRTDGTGFGKLAQDQVAAFQRALRKPARTRIFKNSCQF